MKKITVFDAELVRFIEAGRLKDLRNLCLKSIELRLKYSLSIAKLSKCGLIIFFSNDWIINTSSRYYKKLKTPKDYNINL